MAGRCAVNLCSVDIEMCRHGSKPMHHLNALYFFVLLPPAYADEGSKIQSGCDVCLSPSVCLSVLGMLRGVCDEHPP